MVLNFCEYNEGKMTLQEFYQLTDKKFLPFMKMNDAIRLLVLEANIMKKSGGGDKPSRGEVSNLQNRCTETIAANLNEFINNPDVSLHYVPYAHCLWQASSIVLPPQ